MGSASQASMTLFLRSHHFCHFRQTASVSSLGLADHVTDVHQPEQPHEKLMLLPREHLSEPISDHFVCWHLPHRDPPSPNLLPHLVPMNVDVSKLGIEHSAVVFD